MTEFFFQKDDLIESGHFGPKYECIIGCDVYLTTILFINNKMACFTIFKSIISFFNQR